MRTFLLELLYADGSRKIESVGATWHDAYLRAVKPKKGGKKPVLVCVWSSSKGVIKKAILNREAYIKILKAPVVDAGEVADESEDVADEIENEEATSTPENLDDSE